MRVFVAGFVVSAVCAFFAGGVRAADDDDDGRVSVHVPSGTAAADVLRAHIVVALCDVATQGVVPPPDVSLCDAKQPQKNLYWGARYGVKTFLPTVGWTRVVDDGLHQRFTRRVAGKDVVVDAVAYAAMADAVAAFLDAAADSSGDDIVVFVGHDGLMDIAAPDVRGAAHDVDVAVFACLSERYFGDAVSKTGAARRLLTRDFMAPEAYVVDAYINAVVAGDDVSAAAARAYARYQKLKAPPKRMFHEIRARAP